MDCRCSAALLILIEAIGRYGPLINVGRLGLSRYQS
jgi:hypothetical protein